MDPWGYGGGSPHRNFFGIGCDLESGSRQSEAPVVVCLYDLTRWYLERTDRYRSNLRVTLGDGVDTQLVNIVALVHRASIRREPERVSEECTGLFSARLRWHGGANTKWAVPGW